jgi:hypothetical protein
MSSSEVRKITFSHLFEIEKASATGLSLADAVLSIFQCTLRESQTLAKDPDIVESYERGKAEGAREIMRGLKTAADGGNAAAAKLVMAAQKSQADDEGIETAPGRRLREQQMAQRAIAAAGVSARALAAEQKPHVLENVRRYRGSISREGNE